MKLVGKANYYRATVGQIALMGIIGWSAPSLAQVKAASADSAVGSLQEIVVTAQKRSQRLSDVGISIVAQTAEQLQNAGVSDALQLAKVTPGFTAAESQNGFPIFSIRGVVRRRAHGRKKRPLEALLPRRSWCCWAATCGCS